MSYRLPFKSGDRVVDIGGGKNPLKVQGIKVFNVDLLEVPGVDAVRNLEEDFSDIGEFDGLYCSYVAEHIGWRNVERFFRNCYEVLKDGGVGVFIVPDTLEQMRKVLGKPKITLADSEFLFGGQDFPSNVHKVAFSRDFIAELLSNAGFTVTRILDVDNPEARDIIVEVHKSMPMAPVGYGKKGKSVKEMYDRAYFEDDTDGYVGFWDFPVNFKVVNKVVEMKPESVLDVGAARGYIVKNIEAHGIRAVAMDISDHCFHTRATDSFLLHDATNVPWPFGDNEFDLMISTSFLEHIPEEQLSVVIKEMERVSKRSYHEITFKIIPSDIDTTHQQGTIKPHEWWVNKFKTDAPNYPTKIQSMEEVHSANMEKNRLPPSDGLTKINFGSYISMFYYGWINSDIQDLSTFAESTGRKFIRADARMPLTGLNEAVDLITAHHLIEHLTRQEGATFLRNCYDSMKPGGVIRLSTPDLARIITVYLNSDLKSNYSCVNVGVENAKDEADALFRLLYEDHKTLFDVDGLITMMQEAGFVDVRSMPFNVSRSEKIIRQTVDSYPTLSIYCEGEKPERSIPLIQDPVARGPIITMEPDLKPYQKYLLEKASNEG